MYTYVYTCICVCIFRLDVYIFLSVNKCTHRYSGIPNVLLHISRLVKILEMDVAEMLTACTPLPKFYNCIGVCNGHMYIHKYV